MKYLSKSLFSYEVILSHNKSSNQFPGKMFDILNSLEMIYDDNHWWIYL